MIIMSSTNASGATDSWHPLTPPPHPSQTGYLLLYPAEWLLTLDPIISGDPLGTRARSFTCWGGSPGAMAKAACLERRRSRVRPPLWHLIFKGTKCFFRSVGNSKYCGETPWPRGSVSRLRPSGLEFSILSLEGSVISFISPSSV